MSYVDCTPDGSQEAEYRAMTWVELRELRERVKGELDAAWAEYEAGGYSRDRVEHLLRVLSDVDGHMDQRRAMARLVYGDDAALV